MFEKSIKTLDFSQIPELFWPGIPIFLGVYLVGHGIHLLAEVCSGSTLNNEPDKSSNKDIDKNPQESSPESSPEFDSEDEEERLIRYFELKTTPDEEERIAKYNKMIEETNREIDKLRQQIYTQEHPDLGQSGDGGDDDNNKFNLIKFIIEKITSNIDCFSGILVNVLPDFIVSTIGLFLPLPFVLCKKVFLLYRKMGYLIVRATGIEFYNVFLPKWTKYVIFKNNFPIAFLLGKAVIGLFYFVLGYGLLYMYL